MRRCGSRTKPHRRFFKSGNKVRAVVQRVTEARVRVDDPSTPLGAGRVIGEIGRGLVVLLAVGREDNAADVAYVAAKIREIRIFEGDTGRHMDRSVTDVGGLSLIHI